MRAETIKIDALTKAKWRNVLDFICQMTECGESYIICANSGGNEVAAKGTFGDETDNLQDDAIALCGRVISDAKECILPTIERRGEYKDIKKAMAFMAYPIFLPDKKVYGAICVADAREKQFWNWSRQLLFQYSEFASDGIEAAFNSEKLKELGHTNDIAEIKSRERFKKNFNLSPMAILITAIEDGRVVDANESYLKLFGFGRDELIGKTGIQLSIFDDSNVRRAISRRLETGKTVRDFETSLLTKSGETRQVLVSVDRAEFNGKQCLISTLYDLSSVIHLKQNLRTVNERFSLATRAADMGIWEWNIPKETLVWDDQMTKLFGVKKKDFSGKPQGWLSLIHPDDMRETERKLKLAMSGEKEFISEYRAVRPDGQVRYMKAYGHTLRDDTGMPVRMTGVNFDITDIKTAQAQMRDSEERYRSLFHNNGAIQMIINSETGEITDANSAACEFYGYSRDKMRGVNIWDLDSQEEDELRKCLADAYVKGADFLEMLHRRYDGQQREVEVFCGRVSVDGFKLLHMIIHDVTERKRMERGLIESENRFRLFVESAPDGVFVEIGGFFAYVNRKTMELFDVASEHDLLGRPVEAFFSKGGKKGMAASLRRLNVLKKPVPLINDMIERSGGSRLEVEISAVPFRLGGEDGALVFMHDISVRRQLESDKQKIEAQLKHKQKLESIGVLAGGVAHEINNPISGIINYAQLIYEALDANSETAEYCKEIIREGHRIAGIVKNLLKFARQEKQAHSLADINDIINDTLSLIRTIIRKDKIELEVELEPNLPSIKCRSQQIQQVLMNLITNARDALNARYKGGDDNKKIRLTGTRFENGGGKWIRIIVEDRGLGIPEHIKEKMFDPFFTTKSRDEGTGLGLSISHGIVEDHHGALYFDSRDGQYTRAILELPVNNGWANTARLES
ncbi:MAG: PAS domain S-box protein [Christensenellales bacterium]